MLFNFFLHFNITMYFVSVFGNGFIKAVVSKTQPIPSIFSCIIHHLNFFLRNRWRNNYLVIFSNWAFLNCKYIKQYNFTSLIQVLQILQGKVYLVFRFSDGFNFWKNRPNTQMHLLVVNSDLPYKHCFKCEKYFNHLLIYWQIKRW